MGRTNGIVAVEQNCSLLKNEIELKTLLRISRIDMTRRVSYCIITEYIGNCFLLETLRTPLVNAFSSEENLSFY